MNNDFEKDLVKLIRKYLKKNGARLEDDATFHLPQTAYIPIPNDNDKIEWRAITKVMPWLSLEDDKGHSYPYHSLTLFAWISVFDTFIEEEDFIEEDDE